MTYSVGRAIAGYGAWAIQPQHLLVEWSAQRPAGGAIFACWHGTNFILLAVYHHLFPTRIIQSFAVPGVLGGIARYREAGDHSEDVDLPPDGQGIPLGGLKQMARGLAAGKDAGIAVDGPYGPAKRVRPGAFWLARLSGCPVIPVGCAARTSVRLPRWDQHLVPLPGSPIGVVIGEPIYVARKATLGPAALQTLGDCLDRMNRRAWEIVNLKSN